MKTQDLAYHEILPELLEKTVQNDLHEMNLCLITLLSYVKDAQILSTLIHPDKHVKIEMTVDLINEHIKFTVSNETELKHSI